MKKVGRVGLKAIVYFEVVNGATAMAARLAMAVYENDWLQTGADGELGVTFATVRGSRSVRTAGSSSPTSSSSRPPWNTALEGRMDRLEGIKIFVRIVSRAKLASPRSSPLHLRTILNAEESPSGRAILTAMTA